MPTRTGGSYVDAGTDVKADFCLKAKGDSMINARIHDGDVVFIRKQDIVENGEIAAVAIDDEATLKRFYRDEESGTITLVAENPVYAPMVFTKESQKKNLYTRKSNRIPERRKINLSSHPISWMALILRSVLLMCY